MSESETVLRPFEEEVRASAASRRRRLRRANLWASFRRPLARMPKRSLKERLAKLRARVQEARHELPIALKRTALEVGAVAHSSATLAGVSKDAERAAAAVKVNLAKDSAAIQGLEGALDRAWQEACTGLARALRPFWSAARRLKESALRSSTVSGLAIDSRRLAKRLRRSHAERRGRFAH